MDRKDQQFAESRSTRGKFYTAQGISYVRDENNRIIHWLKKIHSELWCFTE